MPEPIQRFKYSGLHAEGARVNYHVHPGPRHAVSKADIPIVRAAALAAAGER